MRLVEPFEFVGPDGRRWPVPPGTIVDGASIPQFLWSLIGAPFEGLYRDASVLHDHYCETRTRAASDVHQMFKDAMITSGVGTSRAWLMYKAVDKFGPRWEAPNLPAECEIITEDYDFFACAQNSARPKSTMPEPSPTEIVRFLDQIQSEANAQDVKLLKQSIK